MLSCEPVEVESTAFLGIKACEFDVGNIQTCVRTDIETACIFIICLFLSALSRIVAGDYGSELLRAVA